MGTIIWLAGVILSVMAILDVLKKNISGAGKIITIVVLLITSWIGLIIYYLYAKNHLESWFK